MYPGFFPSPKPAAKYRPLEDYSEWKEFVQLYNPFSKMNNITVTIGNKLTVIPRCISTGECQSNEDSTTFVIALLVNHPVVSEECDIQSFEECVTQVNDVFLSFSSLLLTY